MTTARYPKDPARTTRPRTLIAGCVMAWFGGAVLLVLGVLLFFADPEQIIKSANLNASPADVRQTLRLTGIISVVWSVPVLVFATYAFRGRRWAAVGLVVLAGLNVAFALWGLLSGGGGQSGVSLVWSVASAMLVYWFGDSKYWWRRPPAERAIRRP